MTQLYWPRRGTFVDHDRNTEYRGEGTYDVPDDAVDGYLDRGWERPDEDDAEGDTDDTADAGEPTDAAEADDDGDEYVCGAETSEGEPCQNPVDAPDERCHAHADE